MESTTTRTAVHGMKQSASWDFHVDNDAWALAELNFPLLWPSKLQPALMLLEWPPTVVRQQYIDDNNQN